MKCELCHNHAAETVLYRPSKTGGRPEELYVCHTCAAREGAFEERGLQVAAMGMEMAMPSPPQGEMPDEVLPSIELPPGMELPPGVELPEPRELFGKLGEMFGELSERLGSDDLRDSTCPQCGMRLDRVRNEAVVGCAKCLEVFETTVVRLLEEIQHCSTYQGQPSPLFAQVHERKRLEKELADAIAREDYVAAKALREALRRLQLPGSPNAEDASHG